MNTELLKESAAHVLQTLSGAKPACTLILGSGWNDVSAALTVRHSINYSDIPCLGQTAVQGHEGRMLIADRMGTPVMVFQGRRHWYEGTGWEPIAFPVYLSLQLGIRVLILTNAAGSLHNSIQPGELMVIDDHINAMGVNPLIGPHDPVWGPRFPDQTDVYDPELRRLLDRAANKLGKPLTHGIYVAASGPTYETPAEVEAFRRMGAGAIGMSTVPEAILANAAGMRVAGISCITNQAASRSGTGITHEEVLVQATRLQPRMRALIFNLLVDPAFLAVCNED